MLFTVCASLMRSLGYEHSQISLIDSICPNGGCQYLDLVVGQETIELHKLSAKVLYCDLPFIVVEQFLNVFREITGQNLAKGRNQFIFTVAH
jgi:hypothetical protein